jgi:hypothetical protein
MAATALMAFVDPSANADLRHEGALLVAAAIDDLFLLRSVLIQRQGE